MSAMQTNNRPLEKEDFLTLRYFNFDFAPAENQSITGEIYSFHTHTQVHMHARTTHTNTHINERLISCSMGALGIKYVVGNLCSILLDNHD